MRLLRSALAVSSVLALGLTAACTTSTTEPEPGDPVEETMAQESMPEETNGAEAPADSGDVPMGDGSQTIYLVSKGFQHRFWQAVNDGADAAGEEYNYQVEFVGPDDETKVTQQLDQLKTALDSNPSAIGFAALDSDAADPILQDIEAAEIPIIAFDSGVESDLPVTTVSTDNVAAAEEAAEHMIELIGGEGTVGLVCHDQTSLTGQQRCDGFLDYMQENAPEVNVLDPQYAGEASLAANTAKAILQANPDIVGMYGTNEAAATGAVQGANEVGKEDLTVVGFDSGKTQLNAIRDGSMEGAITQSPVKMGYETVVAAIRAINDQDLPEVIDSGFAWYDADNIEDPDIAENLYE